jgi:cellulose synthase operon protein C
MTVSASTQIPKTSDPAVFQRQCKVLFEHVLNDPHIEEFGTSGQGQSGIDLLGRRRARGLDHWVGIQCKLTIKSQKLKAGEKGVVEVEAAKALAFQPKLTELIIATTASNDGVLQREAALFTDRQAKLGRDFTVQVWGWETLSAHILQYEAALKAFYPDAFPQTERIIRGQDKLIEDVGSLAAKQNAFAAEQSSMQALIVRIDRQTAGSIARQAVWDDRSIDTLLDRQIDQLRDMLNAGKPRTALALLEGLWGGLPDGAEGRIRFRIRANIAACLLRLGEERDAAKTYLQAYQYAPSDPKAVSLKVLAYLLLDQPKDALTFGRAALTGGPEEGPLVAYMITAAKLVPDEDDPLNSSRKPWQMIRSWRWPRSIICAAGASLVGGGASQRRAMPAIQTTNIWRAPTLRPTLTALLGGLRRTIAVR